MVTAQYLRFNHQIDRKLSLNDNEKMNYLLTDTTERARRVIENHQGLKNGCQLPYKSVLKQRFGQNALIVEAPHLIRNLADHFLLSIVDFLFLRFIM